MATKRLQLLVDGTTDFEFDVEGEWLPSWEPTYKDAADPPELVSMRMVWEFRGCRIVAPSVSPGTSDDAELWTSLQAFLSRFETRSAHPTYLRLVRDPDGDASTVLQLGDGTDHEQFRVELLSGETDADLPRASWYRTATFTIRASAVRTFEDANGIVLWDQQVNVRYEAGLRVLEWVTSIGTAAGTDAVAKIKAYGAIPTSTLTGSEAYETNGPDGVEWVVEDADEENSRAATLVRGVSRLRSYAIGTGVTSPGSAPDEFDLSVRTITTADSIETITEAAARGPGAYNWVLLQKPGGAITESTVVEGRSGNTASGSWVQRSTNTTAGVDGGLKRTIVVTFAGGRRTLRFKPAANGEAPRKKRGPFAAVKITAEVVLDYQGGTGLRSELPLPALLDLDVDWDASSETEPYVASHGTTPEQSKWQRKATVVYMASAVPADASNMRKQIESGGSVESYGLSTAFLQEGLNEIQAEGL